MAQRGTTTVRPVDVRSPLRPARERRFAWALLGIVVATAAVVATRWGTHGDTELSAVRIGIFVALVAALALVLVRRGRRLRAERDVIDLRT